MSEQASTSAGQKIPGWVWLVAGGVAVVVGLVLVVPMILAPSLPADAQEYVDSHLLGGGDCPSDDCEVVATKKIDAGQFNESFSHNVDEAWCLTFRFTMPASSLSKEHEENFNTFLYHNEYGWHIGGGDDEAMNRKFGCPYYKRRP